MKRPCVYVLTNRRHGTLYVGVTSDVARRVAEHRSGAVEGFTKTHRLDRLVHFELFETMEQAILREKRLKKWRRAWKIQLVEQANPEWRDLSGTLGL